MEDEDHDSSTQQASEGQKSEDKYEKVKSITQEQKTEMQTHKDFSQSGIIADASYEAWDDLSDEHREVVDKADRMDEVSWTPGDAYLELAKHRVGQHKVKYFRSDIYGLRKSDREELKAEGLYEDLKEAVKAWNAKRLDAQLKMTDAKEVEE